ncbi:hypothetical protein DMUE_2642 [Dictyocoela muelleri]|nr:hypothetical protein DMUE_2642 [Dictyocoela muelleri]
MDNDLKKIQLATGCSLSDAKKAYISANKNVNDAIALTKKKYYVGNGQELENKTVKIYQYRNGLFVSDKFYSFSEKEGQMLRKMLDRKEFDKKVLGIDSDYVDVELVTIDDDYKDETCRKDKDEKKNSEPRKPGVKMGQSICCPDVLHVNDSGITLKIKVGGEKRRVIVEMGTKMKKVIEYIQQYTGPGFKVYDDDKNVAEDEVVDNFKNCVLTYKK